MSAFRLGLFALSALSFAAAAQAQSPDETRLRPAWRALDADGDGKVALTETPPLFAGALAVNDHDKDGFITLAEYADFDRDPNGERKAPVPGNVKVIADLNYAGTGDPRQTLDVYLPKQPSVQGPLPVIAYIHGGGWSTGSKILGRTRLMRLVDSGRYASVSIGYRLSWQATWPAQIYDAKAAIRWIRAHAGEYGFDPDRICVLGVSSGAHMAAKLGLTNGEAAVEGDVGSNLAQSSQVKCVIDELGPMDLRNTGVGPPNPVDQLLGGRAGEKPELARSASPILDVDPTDPPFLIIGADKDPFVPHQQSVDLAEALRKAGVPVYFQTVAGGGHGDFGAARPAVEERLQLFLEKNFYDRSTQVPTDTLSR